MKPNNFIILERTKSLAPKSISIVSSIYSKFFSTDPKTQRMEAHKISLETGLYCGLEKFTKDL